MQLVETLKINANYMNIYNTVVDAQIESSKTSEVNFTDTFHDCKMSDAAVKTIKKSVNVIVYLSRKKFFEELNKYKKYSCTGFNKNDLSKRAIQAEKERKKNPNLCTFITLTLPAEQQHTDIELTKYCVNPFLTYLRKYLKVRYYIWKKELQNNGNLHFHFVVDKFIRADALREIWNRIINRGIVDGLNFDYVDRYHNKMIQIFKNGWNENEMRKYYANLQAVKDKIDARVQQLETEKKTQLSFIDFQKIIDAETNSAYEHGYLLYTLEIKKDINDRWRNPNSTDIKAIRNPASIAAYIAKYISKDILDNPKLTAYQNDVASVKQQIFSTLRDINEKKEKNEAVDDLQTVLQHQKELLNLLRTSCPIKGKMWFKSATLTPFLKGAKDFIYSELSFELQALIEYLENKNTDSKKYVVKLCEKDEKGNDILNKIICISLFISVFELERIKDDNNKKKFPLLCGMWKEYINNCIAENESKKLYDVSKAQMKDFNKIK